MSDGVNEKVKEEAAMIFLKAKGLEINDDSSMQSGAETLREIKTVRKRVKDLFKPILDAQKEAMAKTKAEFTKYDKPLLDAEGTLKSKIGSYQLEQEKIRKQKEAELQEQARKQAEELQIAQAAQLEKAGQKDMAEAVLSQPTAVPTVKLEESKAEGVTTRESWSANVISLADLVKACASGECPIDYLEPNQKMLNAMARAQKQAFNVPGVVAEKNVSVVARGY